MKTTLNMLRNQDPKPCSEGWVKLLKHLGKTKADDDELPILIIIDSNGIDDAIWALRAVPARDREIRLFSIWCARQVQHLLADQRSIDALDVAERYANGAASKDDLASARAAARAAYAAAYAARAAYAAAYAADVAYAAAYAADAAAYAADVAARAAARDSARAAQKQKLIEICLECEK